MANKKRLLFGGSLCNLLKKGSISEKEAASIMK